MTERISAAEFRRNHTQGRTPAFVAESDARTAKAAKKSKPSPTNALTKAIIQLLEYDGCTVWRQNNGAVYDASFDGYRAGSVTPGISDVLGYHRPTARIVAVEVKTGKDELSDDQIRFLAGVRAAGGFACEGRDVGQVRKEFITWRNQL